MRNHHLPRDSYNRDAYLSHFQSQSLRLPHRDYSVPSVYHVVCCAQGIAGREPLFEHPTLRQLLKTNWIDLPTLYPSIQLDEFVIMPDHIHLLLWVNKWPERLQRKRPPYLWEIIRTYKSKIAVEWIAYIKANHPTWSARIWQKNYYERMVRLGTLDRVRAYIRENPDQLYEHMGWEKPF